MNNYKNKIIGPFTQLLTMDNLPLKGSLCDSQLKTVHQGGIVVCNGKIAAVGEFNQLCSDFRNSSWIEYVENQMVVIPGLIDPHTHICWAGSIFTFFLG